TIDVTPPTLVLATPADGSATNNPRPAFSGTTDEAGPVTIEIFNGNAATGTPAFTFTANPSGAYSATPPADLPEGPYTARARQSDPFGNEGFSATRAFTADRTAPSISITAPAAGGATNDTTPLITGLAGSVARDTVTVAVDVYPGPTIDAGEAPATTVVTTRDAGGGYSESTPIALAGNATPAGNVYTARARQADTAGNEGRSAPRTFSVDTVVPDATIQLGPDGRADPGAVNRSGRPAFTFTAGEPVAFTCKIDAGAPVPCTSGQSLTAAGGLPLGDGPHTVEVTATDPATNADPTPATRSFSVDSTPPKPRIESPAPGQVVTTSRPTFSGVAGLAIGDRDTITLEVFSGPTPSGAKFPDIQTTHQPNGAWSVRAPYAIRDDQITVRAKQRDEAPGEGFSNPVTFVVDTGAPETSITSGPEGNLPPGTTTRFAFTSSESTATFECRLDGAAFEQCATGKTYGALAAGNHTFDVRAVDAAGNRDASPASRTFTITAPAPAPGPPAPSPPAAQAPPQNAGAARFPSKLELQRSSVSGGRLNVLAPITRRASGTARVAFEAGGRTTRFGQKVDSTRGRLSFERPLAAQQSRRGTGILTISYPGDDDTRAQEVRLRAGPNASGLRTVARPKIDGGRLRARGTTARGARGVVRVSIDWDAADGTTRTLERTASIENGAWSLSSPLPADVRESIAARRGTVHSYTLFTGYLPRRMRGEMLSLEVLPFRG
nr:hypothetical protein [Solirubrobacterales bacterium]